MQSHTPQPWFHIVKGDKDLWREVCNQTPGPTLMLKVHVRFIAAAVDWNAAFCANATQLIFGRREISKCELFRHGCGFFCVRRASLHHRLRLLVVDRARQRGYRVAIAGCHRGAPPAVWIALPPSFFPPPAASHRFVDLTQASQCPAEPRQPATPVKVPLTLGVGAVLNMGTGIDQSRSPHNINR
eukprot:COSAG06_NODE_4851_length_3906_cov_5.089572_4_plen_185_part_00